jgi:hypothetical protein
MIGRSLLHIVLLGCISLLIGGEIVRAQSTDNTNPTVGRIILIKPPKPRGKLRVEYGKGFDSVDATEGMLIRRGDLLTLKATAKAQIICGNGNKYDLIPGPQGCPCTDPCTTKICGLMYDDKLTHSMRGGDTNNSSFPVIISPRKTLLLNKRPTIRWSPVAGSNKRTKYKVSLYGENRKLIWSRVTGSKPELAYPYKKPSLTPGQTYLVVVSTDGKSSELENVPGIGFALLKADKALSLNKAKAKIQKLNLPEAQTQFLTANLYLDEHLYAEAIDEVERASGTMKEPAVVRMLGDLYLVVGLNREAEKRYLEALTIQPKNDLEEQAMTQMRLAQSYENLGISDQAIIRLDEAIKIYERLGNSAMVEILKKQEQGLKK